MPTSFNSIILDASVAIFANTPMILHRYANLGTYPSVLGGLPQNVFGVSVWLANGQLACEIPDLLARSSGQDHHFIAIGNDE